MADLKFRIKAQSENATKTVVKARHFEFVIDEPAALGGADAGPNPVEYLLAAFAGCLNVMSHLIAKEMNMQLNGVKIEIAGNLNPAKLFGQSNEDRAGYKEIVVKITPDTDATPEVLAQWLNAVTSRCPVSDNIKNITPVTVELGKCK